MATITGIPQTLSTSTSFSTINEVHVASNEVRSQTIGPRSFLVATHRYPASFTNPKIGRRPTVAGSDTNRSGSTIATQDTDYRFNQPGVCGDTSFADLNYIQNDTQYIDDEYIDIPSDAGVIEYTYSETGSSSGTSGDCTFQSPDRFYFNFPEIPSGRPDNNITNVTVNADISFNTNIGSTMTVLPDGDSVSLADSSFGDLTWTGSNNVIGDQDTIQSMQFTCTPGMLSTDAGALPIRLILNFTGNTINTYNHLSTYRNNVKIHKISMTITYTGKTALTTRFIPCDTAQIKWLGNGRNRADAYPRGTEYAVTSNYGAHINEEVARHVDFTWNANTISNLPGVRDYAFNTLNILEFITQSDPAHPATSSLYSDNIHTQYTESTTQANSPIMINDYEVFQSDSSLGRGSIRSNTPTSRRWVPDRELDVPDITLNGGNVTAWSQLTARGDLDVPRPNLLSIEFFKKNLQTLEQPSETDAGSKTLSFAAADFENLNTTWKLRRQLDPFTAHTDPAIEEEFNQGTTIESLTKINPSRSENDLKFPSNIKAYVQFTYIPGPIGVPSTIATTSTFTHGLLGVEHRLSSSDVGTHNISSTLVCNGGIRQDADISSTANTTMVSTGRIVNLGVSEQLFNYSLTATPNPIVSPFTIPNVASSFTTSIVGNIHYKENQDEVGIKAFSFAMTTTPTLFVKDPQPINFPSSVFTLPTVTTLVFTVPGKYRRLVLNTATRIATATEQTRIAAVDSQNRIYIHPAEGRTASVNTQSRIYKPRGNLDD